MSEVAWRIGMVVTVFVVGLTLALICGSLALLILNGVVSGMLMSALVPWPPNHPGPF